MTKFETMDKMNNNFVTLTENDLVEVDGGIAPILIGVGIVAGLGGGFGLGYILARKFG